MEKEKTYLDILTERVDPADVPESGRAADTRPDEFERRAADGAAVFGPLDDFRPLAALARKSPYPYSLLFGPEGEKFVAVYRRLRREKNEKGDWGNFERWARAAAESLGIPNPEIAGEGDRIPDAGARFPKTAPRPGTINGLRRRMGLGEVFLC